MMTPYDLEHEPMDKDTGEEYPEPRRIVGIQPPWQDDEEEEDGRCSWCDRRSLLDPCRKCRKQQEDQ